MSLTKATFSMISGAVLNVLDFGADPTGTDDSQPAIQAAVDQACSGTDGANYAAPYRTVFIPSGVYKMGAPLVIPSTSGGAMCAIIGEGNAFHCPSLLQAHAGHMIVLGSATQAASPRIENLVIQGNKTTYAGNYHGIVQTTTGTANTAFQTFRNVMVRDMGGVGIYMDYAFYVNFHDVTVAYNTAGGMYIGGGAGNNMTVCTQNNLGYGIYFGAQGSFCQFFIEGDCIDNNPAGLNYANYELNIQGGSNRIGANITTNVNNNKTGIAINGANNILDIVVDSSLADPKLTFGINALYNFIGGNLGNSPSFYTGEASALGTSFFQGPGGERLILGGDSTSSPAVKGLHTGFDTTTNVGFMRSTFPGTANYPFEIGGNPIRFGGKIATDQYAAATTATPANVKGKITLCDSSGALIGYIPVYTTL